MAASRPSQQKELTQAVPVPELYSRVTELEEQIRVRWRTFMHRVPNAAAAEARPSQSTNDTTRPTTVPGCPPQSYESQLERSRHLATQATTTWEARGASLPARWRRRPLYQFLR